MHFLEHKEVPSFRSLEQLNIDNLNSLNSINDKTIINIVLWILTTLLFTILVLVLCFYKRKTTIVVDNVASNNSNSFEATMAKIL